MTNVLSFDFGASSARAVLGTYDGDKLSLKEVHRFENIPLKIEGTLYWDIDMLFNEVKQTLTKVCSQTKVESVAVDTWGVDFGLIDENGELISNPVHYRDTRTEGLVEEVEKYISLSDLYKKTGNQIININTIFQLAYLQKYKRSDLDSAKSMLLMPDLFNYLLTGVEKAEETIASTTQLMDPYKKGWNDEIIEMLNLPRKIFKEIVKPGEEIGKISEQLAEELSIPRIPVVAAASHDTASAVAGIPATDDDFLFISSGTWSLIGTELDSPNISAESTTYNITNESGINGTTRFLKNVTGLWVLQETKRQFESEGRNYTYDEITKLAEEAKEFTCLIDTDHDDFQSPGNMPTKIRKYAEKTQQPIPETDGQMFRSIYESLALKYRYTFEEIEESVGKKFNRVHILGGGSQAEILCQMVANITNIEVVAGPIEATVIGNSLVQLISQNAITDIKEGRKVVQQSFPVKYYFPERYDKRNNNYNSFKRILNSKGSI